MFNLSRLTAFLFCGLAALAGQAIAAESTVPEPFRGFDDNSTYTITYADVNALLDMAVLNVGRSTREKATPTKALTGTRMTARVNASTADEGNRFYYESFQEHEENRQALIDIRHSLEKVPEEAPLKYFSRTEQLAYWLNLYNITMLSEVVEVYPKRSLKKDLTGKNSILSKKILTVAGIPLSLNDIQYTILKENYDSNPLIIYGLYQGVIGGPNIRKRAYTGENVYRYLADNAAEFINSNRGSYAKDEKVFRVSSLYQRNKSYFKDFDKDLREHLLIYLQGQERGELQAANTIKPDIDDWGITDLYGSRKPIGGSLATNRAALMDSTRDTSVAGEGQGSGGFVTSSTATEGASLMGNAARLSRFSPDVLIRMQELKERQKASAEKAATVTVEDIVKDTDEPGDQKKDDKQDK
jgi:hypothetical protein